MKQAEEGAGDQLRDLHLQSERRLAIAALLLMIIPSVWFVRTDLALFFGNWPAIGTRFAVRALLIAVMLGGIVALLRVRTRAAYSSTVLVATLGIAAGYVALNALRPAGSGVPMRTPLLALAAMYAALPNTLPRQTIAPVLMSIGLAILAAGRLRTPGTDIVGDVVVLGVFNALGILVVGRRLQLEAAVRLAWQRRQEARAAAHVALSELQTLQGIIPICAHCKRVQSEVGSWQQIEEYVRRRSAAEFSHGICPSCRDTHYTSIGA